MRHLFVRLRKDAYVPVRPHLALQHGVGPLRSFGPRGSNSDAHFGAGLDLETVWGGCGQ